jgi:hypothetical protein
MLVLDTKFLLLYPLSLLKSSGAFEVAGGAKPNDLAAIQVNPNSTDWILATVISQDPDTGMYQLADEDAESNKGEHPQERVLPTFSWI